MALYEVVACWAVSGMEGNVLLEDFYVCFGKVGAGAECGGMNKGGVGYKVGGEWEFWAWWWGRWDCK